MLASMDYLRCEERYFICVIHEPSMRSGPLLNLYGDPSLVLRAVNFINYYGIADKSYN